MISVKVHFQINWLISIKPWSMHFFYLIHGANGVVLLFTWVRKTDEKQREKCLVKFLDSNKKIFKNLQHFSIELHGVLLLVSKWETFNICKILRRDCLSWKGLSWNEQKNPRLLLFIAVDHQFYRKDQEEKQWTTDK